MVNEEPVLRRDFVAMGQLVIARYREGHDYTPDVSLKPILSRAAESGHTRFMREVQGGDPWWPGLHWKLVEHVGAKTGFTFETDHALFVDERARVSSSPSPLPRNWAARPCISSAPTMLMAPVPRRSDLPVACPPERAREAILGSHAL